MFEIHGTDFRKLGSVENPSSANYSIYFQEIGGLTLIAAATEENRELLKNEGVSEAELEQMSCDIPRSLLGL